MNFPEILVPETRPSMHSSDGVAESGMDILEASDHRPDANVIQPFRVLY